MMLFFMMFASVERALERPRLIYKAAHRSAVQLVISGTHIAYHDGQGIGPSDTQTLTEVRDEEFNTIEYLLGMEFSATIF